MNIQELISAVIYNWKNKWETLHDLVPFMQ